MARDETHLISVVDFILLGNGLKKLISSCPVRCFFLVCRGCLERRRNRSVNNLVLIQPVEEELDFEED